jgi:hypothetical protein
LAGYWHVIRTEEAVITKLIGEIDDTRMAIKMVLKEMS